MRWIKDHLALVGIALIGFIALVSAIVFRRDDKEKLKGLADNLKLEKKVIDAKSDAAKQTALVGHEQAVASIKEEHKENIAKMDDEDKKKADALSRDPEALAEHLVRASMQ